MDFTFNDALRAIEASGSGVFTLMNAARPPAQYLFNTLLPERAEYDYDVKDGDMTVRATMPGLAATDSPYPPGGLIEMSKFMAEVAKMALHVPLTEASLRRLQQMMLVLKGNGGDQLASLVNEVLNFVEKVHIQAHLDRMEWLRGQALINGKIDWTFNGQRIVVDYGVPADHILANRTGTDAWNGTTSKFWTDVRTLQSKLRYDVRALIAHIDTIYAIIDNEANNAELLRQDGTVFTFRRLVGSNERPDSDVRYTVNLIAYQDEGEILDPANPGSSVIVPFMPTGKILAIGNNKRSGYRVGEGSTPDPQADKALGYTHLAPTVESGGKPGRWAQVYTPEELPMQLHGRSVTNGLPVITAPQKVAVASSDLS